MNKKGFYGSVIFLVVALMAILIYVGPSFFPKYISLFTDLEITVYIGVAVAVFLLAQGIRDMKLTYFPLQKHVPLIGFVAGALNSLYFLTVFTNSRTFLISNTSIELMLINALVSVITAIFLVLVGLTIFYNRLYAKQDNIGLVACFLLAIAAVTIVAENLIIVKQLFGLVMSAFVLIPAFLTTAVFFYKLE